MKKDKILSWLSTVYPNLKQDELEQLRSINTQSELEDLAEQMGMSDKEIKDLFK